jgi:hypothetical protein
MSAFKRFNHLAKDMSEDEPKVLVPVLTGNIVLRDLPYSVKQRLINIKRQMSWNSWAEMAIWVNENSEKIGSYDFQWPQDELGYIVCRNLPIELKDNLSRLKRIHGWAKWTEMVPFIIFTLEENT